MKTVTKTKQLNWFTEIFEALPGKKVKVCANEIRICSYICSQKPKHLTLNTNCLSDDYQHDRNSTHQGDNYLC